MNIQLFLSQGGPLLWLLLILLLASSTLIIERMLLLHQAKIDSHQFLSGIKNLLSKRRLIEALTLCEQNKFPASNVIKAALLNYNLDEPLLTKAVQEAALIEIPILERRISFIAIVAKISPLIGIVGTLINLSLALAQINQQGPYANIADLSAHLSNSIFVTIFSLVISIISYLGYHLLLNRINSLIHDMEWSGHQIIQFLLKDFPSSPPSSNP